MGVYQKMKAAIYDLTEALDEAVAFNAAVPALAGAGNANVHFDEKHAIPSILGEEKARYGNAARFTMVHVS